MENVVLRASLSQAFQLKIDNQCNEKINRYVKPIQFLTWYTLNKLAKVLCSGHLYSKKLTVF